MYWHNGTYNPINEYVIRAQRDENWIERFVGDPIALFTFVLTCATLGLYLATRQLWNATEKLVIGADETARRQLRAYVGVVEAFISNRDINGEPTELTVRIKNFGATPALDYSIRVGWTDTRRAYGRTADDLPHRQNPSTLMPGAIDETALLSSRQFLSTSIIFGRIIYKDVFGEEKFTNFRLMSRMGSDRFTPDTTGNDSS